MTRPACLAAALAYAWRLGWAVFSVNGKVPFAGTHGFLDATKDPEIIRAMWEGRPEANVAVATGAVSGLVGLDVDPRHGGDVALDEIEAKYGPLPETVESLTGGGGRHLLFKHPGGEVKNSSNAVGQGLDVRGDGGLLVLPPSIHPETGRAYCWEGAHRPLEMPIAPMPAWLAERLVETQESRQGPPTDWTALVSTKVGKAHRTPTLTRLVGHWLGHGLDPEEVVHLAAAWNARFCDPPHEEAHILATCSGIFETRLRNTRKVGSNGR